MAFISRSSVRWGIVGCGDVTEVKSGPGFQKASGSELVAVMRRNGKLAEDYARRHGVPRWYDDADRMIGDPEVDAVYVATPPSTHEFYAMKALAAGKPCYVEKPMARNHAECARMVEGFGKAGVPLFVAYYRRGLARFTRTKELIEAGRIGKVTSVGYRFAHPPTWGDRTNLPWRLDVETSGGGIYLDLASHTLDILDFMLGQLSSASGIAANVASDFDAEDSVAMTFQLPSGALGAASWNFVANHKEDRIEIVGNEGRIVLSTFGNEAVQVFNGEKMEALELPNPPHIQQNLIQAIVNDLLGKGKSPSTGETGARTSKVMDTVLEGYYGTRGDGFWKEPGKWPGRRGR